MDHQIMRRTEELGGYGRQLDEDEAHLCINRNEAEQTVRVFTAKTIIFVPNEKPESSPTFRATRAPTHFQTYTCRRATAGHLTSLPGI